MRNLVILAVTALIVALPFVFRRETAATAWNPGDPVLVVISPHNEAIRQEFGDAFAAWHAKHYGQPVKLDWRVIGGTTEIMRYLKAEYAAAFKAWWQSGGRPWPASGSEMITDRKFNPSAPPPETATDPAARRRWAQRRDLYRTFRDIDDPAQFTCRIDLFFGGGAYDHNVAHGQGLIVRPWPDDDAPEGILTDRQGRIMIPEGRSGEIWRTDFFIGTCLSTFGICYNVDRLDDLHIMAPPRRWQDLTDPAYFGQIALADPTKSGSISKAFEMIIHEQCHVAVRAAGYTSDAIETFEQAIHAAHLEPGQMPPEVPEAYQQAVERGWLNGLQLVRRLAANARYFTDGAGRVPIDVGAGDAAAGLAIDFYGRFQAEMSRGQDGRERMVYVTPAGGSSVSADPISLLRGAEHRELALRFICFVLGEDGQKLWNQRPGTPGGPRRFALRRLPIRRDFYPSPDEDLQAAYLRHSAYTSDALGDPAVDPYALSGLFLYVPRWTAYHFGIQRDLIRAMCMDAGEELRAAWAAIVRAGGPEQQPSAMAALERMPTRPETLTWGNALTLSRRHNEMDYMREWTLFFRESYGEARERATAKPGEKAKPKWGATP